MKTAKSHTILIVEPDVQFREELYNFLLAAGYEQVTATDSLTTVLEHIRHAAYDVILAAAGSTWGWRLTSRSRHSGIEPHNKDHSHDQRGGSGRLAAMRSTSDRRAFPAQEDLCAQRVVPPRRLPLAATGDIRDVSLVLSHSTTCPIWGCAMEALGNSPCAHGMSHWALRLGGSYAHHSSSCHPFRRAP